MPGVAHPRRSVRLVALAAAGQLVASVCTAVVLQHSIATTVTPTRSRPVPALADTERSGSDRVGAVRALLRQRAAAVLAHDRERLLDTIDPAAAALRARQARLLDALRDVPLSGWTYSLDPSHAQPPSRGLDRRYGTWWAPDVSLHYALAGFDAAPTERQQGLTFVRRAGRWYLAADDDFRSHRTAYELWDGGSVVVARGASTLVLAHPDNGELVELLLRETDAAVPRVTAVWGQRWAQRVVLVVPASEAELRRLLPDLGDLSQIAALATAELTHRGSGYHSVGDRVLIDPPNFARLGSLGRRVVLAHEVTHVASREATGPAVPTWLVEGLADYVGYHGLGVPLSTSAGELGAEVRAGQLPARLPADQAFAGNDPALAQVYEQSWLAVVLLARTYGEPALLRLYRTVGSGQPLAQVMMMQLNTTEAAFTVAWRDALRRELA